MPSKYLGAVGLTFNPLATIQHSAEEPRFVLFWLCSRACAPSLCFPLVGCGMWFGFNVRLGYSSGPLPHADWLGPIDLNVAEAILRRNLRDVLHGVGQFRTWRGGAARCIVWSASGRTQEPHWNEPSGVVHFIIDLGCLALLSKNFPGTQAH